MSPLVTFKGWEGKWWKNIKPGRAAASALLTVLPGSGTVATLAKGAGQRVGSKLIRGASRKIGRWFRGARGGASGVRPGGGSRVTPGKLDLGGGKSFSAGRAFNIGTAAKVGAGGVAAVGAAHAFNIGKTARPGASVEVANRAAPAPARLERPGSAGASGTKRCGCPAGQRMLCFKRKHNPEAQAKRRARRKAARERSKAKTAKRHAKEKAAVARRKSARAARKVRRGVRRVLTGRKR